MNKTATIWTVIIIIVLLGIGAWWVWGRGAATPTTQQETATSSPAAAEGTLYQSGNLALGQNKTKTGASYLIGFNGRALYTFDKDTTGVSNCSGQCAALWPPYLVPSASVLANVQAGVTGTLGTIMRADGGMQVTLNGKPLYFYAPDTDTSGPTGDGIGGVWHLAKSGAATSTSASATTKTTVKTTTQTVTQPVTQTSGSAGASAGASGGASAGTPYNY